MLIQFSVRKSLKPIFVAFLQVQAKLREAFIDYTLDKICTQFEDKPTVH